MEIENNKECFVMLWRMLERTRRLLAGQNKRFCIRRILQSWVAASPPALLRREGAANARKYSLNDFVWNVCRLAELEGYQELPIPQLYPRPHREFLRAFVATYLNIGIRQVNLKALDEAFSVAFPHSTPLNINKKGKKYEKGKNQDADTCSVTSTHPPDLHFVQDGEGGGEDGG